MRVVWRAAAAIAVLVCVTTPASSSPRRSEAADTAAALGPPDHLQVDGLADPIGIDDVPAFSWHVRDERREAVQRAYRVLVGTAPMTSANDGGIIWDTGSVASNRQAFVRYDGPALASDAVYWWTVATADADGRFGPFADARRFETGLHDADWHAQWIHRSTTDGVDAADEYTYARTEVGLPSSPVVRARAYISADQQYQLWVNGTKIGAGEAFSYPDSQYYEAWDVTGALHTGGPNAIGVLTHWYGVGKGRPEGVSGLLVHISIAHADGSIEQVVTDGSWRVSRAPWLPATQRNTEGDPVHYTEHINGVAVPTGWDRPGFDDRLWSRAVALGEPPVPPWTHLSALRTHIVEEPVTPVAVTRLADGSVVADYGRVIAARPTVSFRNGVAGRAVNMHAGYLLDEPQPGAPVVGVPGQVSTMHGTQHTDMSYAYIQTSGPQTFSPYDYLGFRYFQVDAPGEELDASQLVAYARHASLPDDGRASFSSSDPTVDAVFALAQHSARFGSQEQFIDTPTREKGPFLRDGFNISAAAMRGLGDQNLTHRALLEFAQSQTRYWPDGRLNAIYPSGQGKRDIPDFTEIYPEWVWQYFLNTGDDQLLEQVYPMVVAIADYVDRSIDSATGLVTNLPGGDGDYLYGIVDWPKNMRYGYDMSTTARTTVNILAADVFDRVARVADILGHSDEAETQRARRGALVAAINTRLRRADGIYVDGLRGDGGRSDHASQHANAYAIAYGIAPDRDREAIATYVASLGTTMGPQTAQALLDSLRIAGHETDLVSRLTDPDTDGWANVLAQGGTFTWETWQPSDANGDSMSHGWGSTVLVAIQEALLGVAPAAPGDEAIIVRPPSGGLDHATGTLPTPRGTVTVAWHRPADSTDAFTLDVTVPPNMRATVELPASDAGAVTEGGQPLARVQGARLVELRDDRAVLEVGSGSYSFASGSVPAEFVGTVAGHALPNGAASAATFAEPSAPVPPPPAPRASTVAPTTHKASSRRPPVLLVVLVAAGQLSLMVAAVRLYRRRDSSPLSTA